MMVQLTQLPFFLFCLLLSHNGLTQMSNAAPPAVEVPETPSLDSREAGLCSEQVAYYAELINLVSVYEPSGYLLNDFNVSVAAGASLGALSGAALGASLRSQNPNARAGVPNPNYDRSLGRSSTNPRTLPVSTITNVGMAQRRLAERAQLVRNLNLSIAVGNSATTDFLRTNTPWANQLRPMGEFRVRQLLMNAAYDLHSGYPMEQTSERLAREVNRGLAGQNQSRPFTAAEARGMLEASPRVQQAIEQYRQMRPQMERVRRFDTMPRNVEIMRNMRIMGRDAHRYGNRLVAGQPEAVRQRLRREGAMRGAGTGAAVGAVLGGVGVSIAGTMVAANACGINQYTLSLDYSPQYDVIRDCHFSEAAIERLLSDPQARSEICEKDPRIVQTMAQILSTDTAARTELPQINRISEASCEDNLLSYHVVSNSGVTHQYRISQINGEFLVQTTMENHDPNLRLSLRGEAPRFNVQIRPEESRRLRFGDSLTNARNLITSENIRSFRPRELIGLYLSARGNVGENLPGVAGQVAAGESLAMLNSTFQIIGPTCFDSSNGSTSPGVVETEEPSET